jgi:hypothetical protein
VSVSGTGRPGTSLEAFLGSRGSLTSPDTARHHVSPWIAPRICLWCGLHAYPGTTTGRAQLPSCVTPSLTYHPPGPHTHHQRPEGHPAAGAVSTAGFGVGRSHTGTGISTRSPSTTPLGLALGPDSPRAEQPGPGTLGHPAEGILTLHALLMPAFSLAPPPPHDPSAASPVARRSPTHPHTCTDRTMPAGGAIVWMPQLRRCA